MMDYIHVHVFNFIVKINYCNAVEDLNAYIVQSDEPFENIL